MNSLQLNFFITPDDLKEIDIFFKEQKYITIKNNVLKPEILPDYDLKGAAVEKIFEVYLTEQKFLKNISFKYLEEKNYYYVYERSSEVVQFSIGGFYPYSDKELHRSRLYYVIKYYDANDQLVSKNEEFLQWANQFFKSFKKRFLKLSNGIYFSEKAQNWVSNNNARLVKGGLKFEI